MHTITFTYIFVTLICFSIEWPTVDNLWERNSNKEYLMIILADIYPTSDHMLSAGIFWNTLYAFTIYNYFQKSSALTQELGVYLAI